MELKIDKKFYNPQEIFKLALDLFEAQNALKHLTYSKVGIMEDYVVEDLLTPELLENYTYLRNFSIGFVKAFKECEEELAEYRKNHPEK